MELSDLQRRTSNFAGELAAFLEQRPALFVSLFSIAYFATFLLLGALKPLWFDEIGTVYHAQADMGIWAALKHGADGNPPLLYVVLRTVYRLIGESDFSTRLPSVIAFWVMSLCIFFFVSRRSSVLFGAAATMYVVITTAVQYAYEARPYALLLAFTGLALCAWSAAARGERRAWSCVALTLALAGAVSTHYFAILLWIPLGAGELVRTIRRRQIDWAVWIALILGLTPLPFWLPLIAALRANTTHYWARPSLSSIEDTYRSFLNLSMAPFMGAIVLWGVFQIGGRDTKESRGGKPGASIPAEEWTAVGLLAALPVFGVGLGFVIGGYTGRYAIGFLVGIVIVMALVAHRASRGSPLLGMALLVVFSGWFLLKAPSTANALRAERGGSWRGPARPFDRRSWASIAEHSDLPIAVTNHVYYWQLLRYPPGGIGSRLYYLTDIDAAGRYAAPTSETFMLAVRDFSPAGIEDYKTFLSSHPRFLVCANLNQPTWLLDKLAADGASIRLLAKDDIELLFEVTLASPAPLASR